jgi:hypothetical protein
VGGGGSLDGRWLVILVPTVLRPLYVLTYFFPDTSLRTFPPPESRPHIYMSFLDKVARIRAELIGAASDMPAAQVVAAALPLMSIVPEPSWALPQMVDAIIEKMTGGGSTTQASSSNGS